MARIMPMGGNASTSAPTTTATTPGAFRAASTSSAATRAWACGLCTKTTCATPSIRRSSRNRPWPRSSGGSSRRRRARPTWVMGPRIVQSRPCPARGVVSRWPPPSWAPRRTPPPRSSSTRRRGRISPSARCSSPPPRPPTPQMGDSRWVRNLPLPLRGLIWPKPATWLQELFWGRRNTLALSWGDVGSIAFYPLYHEHRDRIVHLAPEYSRLFVNFPDADHLRIEQIEPASATRRGSRLRAGTEVVSLPLNTVDAAPQVLKVNYAYYRGVFSWRPVLISIGLLILGNLAGLWMISGEVRRFVRSRLRVGREHAERERTLTPERLAEIKPGQSTYDDVARLCGLPDEEHRRVAAAERRTLVYREMHRRPERRLSVGWLTAVRHWDIERYEVEIELDGERVEDIVFHVRRSRANAPD